MQTQSAQLSVGQSACSNRVNDALADLFPSLGATAAAATASAGKPSLVSAKPPRAQSACSSAMSEALEALFPVGAVIDDGGKAEEQQQGEESSDESPASSVSAEDRRRPDLFFRCSR